MKPSAMEMADLLFGKDKKLKTAQILLSNDIIQSFMIESVTRQKIFSDKDGANKEKSG
jgi:hypothetical protein